MQMKEPAACGNKPLEPWRFLANILFEREGYREGEKSSLKPCRRHSAGEAERSKKGPGRFFFVTASCGMKEEAAGEPAEASGLIGVRGREASVNGEKGSTLNSKGVQAEKENTSVFGPSELYHGEYDPGSERTLAARLKHASRAASASNGA